MTPAPAARPLDRVPVNLPIVTASIAFFCAVFVRSAWLADEAFIDFRTVANVAHGHGLRWNVVERIQTFTDPLWVLVLAGATWFSENIPVTALLLDGIFAVAAVVLVCAVASDVGAATLAVVALALSRAFVDSSSAGLSDALAALILAAVLALSWRAPQRPGWIAVLVGLIPLVSVPALLILAPVVASTMSGQPPRWRRRAVVLAAAPSLLWAAFAVFYFGLPLPAPFYASWLHPHQWLALVAGGAHYLLMSMLNDPISLVLIAVALGYSFRRESRGARAPAIGLVAYLIWIVVSGGSAMSGRLLAPAALTAAMVLARSSLLTKGRPALVALASIVLLGCISARPTFLSWQPPDRGARTDEQLLTYQKTGLLRANRYDPYPDLMGFEPEIERLIAENGGVAVTPAIGTFAYAAGPRLVVVDPYGRVNLPDDDLVKTLARESLWSSARLRSVLRLNVTTAGGLLPHPRVSSEQAK